MCYNKFEWRRAVDLKSRKGSKMAGERAYMCIDLKSFYASVECVERGLDPLTTNLVVADPERTEKTICLAVSPSLRALGVPNRCRVFQIPKNLKYIMASPRMKLYMEYSAEIYGIYLKYIAKEDIYVYSIDEAFLDVTDYLAMYHMTARELGIRIMQDITASMGVVASCGIGTNLYLAKVALDITAKHSDGHIGILDEEAYCRTLWEHKPLTDFWRIGAGTMKRLATVGISTMGQLAQAPEDTIYKLFGIDAELLIDHAWGRESTSIADIKAYKPKANCLSSAQILSCEHGYEESLLVVKEMADMLCLDLVDKGLVTQSIFLYVGYSRLYDRESSKGTITMNTAGNSARMILPYVEKLFRRIADPNTPISRVSLSYNNVTQEAYQQYDLFTDPAELEKERRIQEAVLSIKKKFGKNAILKGMDLQEGATAMERNRQIGGHKSGE